MTDWGSWVFTRRWRAVTPPAGQWTLLSSILAAPVDLSSAGGYLWRSSAITLLDDRMGGYWQDVGPASSRSVGAAYAAQTGIGKAVGVGDPCCDSCAATGSMCSCPQEGPEYSWEGGGSDLTAPCRPCSNSGMQIALSNNANEGLGARRGFGDAGAFATASADLATLLGGAKVRGDAALTGGDYVTAISEYQSGGNAGAVTVGPEIDNAGAGSVTQPLTQQAWVLNQSLAGISGSAQTDAQKAQGLLLNMITLYSQAIAAGLQALQGPPGPGPNPGPPIPPIPPNPNPNPAPSPAPSSTTADYTVPILAGSGVVAALIVGWAVMSKRGGL